METKTEPFAISFPAWFDARAEFETPLKGHLGGVRVWLENGLTYELYFTDPVRLQQTLDDDAKSGREYYSESGLVVVPEVTPESIRKAVSGLWHDGFFQHLRPVE